MSTYPYTIGQRIIANGYVGTVVGTPDYPNYGAVSEFGVQVRLPGGVAQVSLFDTFKFNGCDDAVSLIQTCQFIQIVPTKDFNSDSETDARVGPASIDEREHWSFYAWNGEHTHVVHDALDAAVSATVAAIFAANPKLEAELQTNYGVERLALSQVSARIAELSAAADGEPDELFEYCSVSSVHHY